MKTGFADTFYFFALINDRDRAHARATAFSRSFSGRMVTTTWVLTELADGLCREDSRDSFSTIFDLIESDPDTEIVKSTDELWRDGITLYNARPDKEWSLTDCISFVVMEREALTEVLTGDHHFEQAGFIALLK